MSIPARLRALAHRRMALSAVRANSSLSVRLARYNHHAEIARALEAQGSASMTHALRAAGAVPGFIECRVVINVPGQEPFRLPAIIGRSSASAIASLLHSDFPDASISIQERCQCSLDGLDEALRVSDDVRAMLVDCQHQSRPGAALLKHFKIAARVGGVQ